MRSVSSFRRHFDRHPWTCQVKSQVLAELTKSGAIMGTPQYMAPEQASGRIGEVGPSADIYSLGAIMYEMLTGRPPFTGDPLKVITEVISRPPVPPSQERDSIEPVLEVICMKCLEKTARTPLREHGEPCRRPPEIPERRCGRCAPRVLAIESAIRVCQESSRSFADRPIQKINDIAGGGNENQELVAILEMNGPAPDTDQALTIMAGYVGYRLGLRI